jgi:uncharacterized protein
MERFQLTPGQSIAVVGLSAKPDRPSYDVARAMQRAGFRIVGVNPQYAGESILGETCVASLADIAHCIDIVNCFRRSEEMVAVATAAAKLVPTPKREPLPKPLASKSLKIAASRLRF